MLLNQRIRGRVVFRTIYFLPVVTSTIAASIVWTWIFQPRYGLIGTFLEPFGWRDTAWLTRPNLVLYPVAFVHHLAALGLRHGAVLGRLTGSAACTDGSRHH